MWETFTKFDKEHKYWDMAAIGRFIDGFTLFFYLILMLIAVGGDVFAQQQEMVSVTISSNIDAIIYVDGTIKGTTTWTGNVSVGKHKIRVEKENFFSREYEIVVVKGREMNVDLMLTPKTGAIDIETDPSQAMISINGRLYGFSPRVIADLPYGEYEVVVEKPEYSRVVRRVKINDVKPVKLELSLYSGREVTLNTNPSGAEVYIEQELKGVTPLTIWLRYGTHLIRFEKSGMSIAEKLVVAQSGRKSYTFDLRSTNDPFENQLVFVKGGTFRMGDNFGDGNKEEKPVHQVTVSDFYISKYEVTQAQWTLIMGSNPSHFAGCDDCPVERVNWLEAQDYIAKLNELTQKQYRLPTEAEWEYAARGGQESRGFRYAGRNNINFVAWYSGNSGNRTHPVGTMEPNELGLYDMSGNVWEWVFDWFDFYTDSPTPVVNPKGPDNGDFRIVRGGSWYGYIGGSRVACRGSDDPSNKRSYIGVRLVLSVEKE
jgi:formylglycine-generating enzyme required for sulfatase activity